MVKSWKLDCAGRWMEIGMISDEEAALICEKSPSEFLSDIAIAGESKIGRLKFTK